MQCLHKNIFLHGQGPSQASPKTKRSWVVQGGNHRMSCDNFGPSSHKTELPIQITQFTLPLRCRNPDSRSSKESLVLGTGGGVLPNHWKGSEGVHLLRSGYGEFYHGFTKRSAENPFVTQNTAQGMNRRNHV
jgi:hypothetical protein